jgi:hypothetical protein
MNNHASKDLAEAAPAPGERQTYDTRSKRKGVPLSTLYHHEHGRPSRKKKAEGQQYLTVPEEKALETFLKLMSDFGYPMRIKFLPCAPAFHDKYINQASKQELGSGRSEASHRTQITKGWGTRLEAA